MAADELGADGAHFRVHHFARQLASPFPLLAAVGALTSRIDIDIGVIDMPDEKPRRMTGVYPTGAELNQVCGQSDDPAYSGHP